MGYVQACHPQVCRGCHGMAISSPFVNQEGQITPTTFILAPLNFRPSYSHDAGWTAAAGCPAIKTYVPKHGEAYVPKHSEDKSPCPYMFRRAYKCKPWERSKVEIYE